MRTTIQLYFLNVNQASNRRVVGQVLRRSRLTNDAVCQAFLSAFSNKKTCYVHKEQLYVFYCVIKAQKNIRNYCWFGHVIPPENPGLFLNQILFKKNCTRTKKLL